MIDGNPMASGEQMNEKKKPQEIVVEKKKEPERVKVAPVAPPEHLQQDNNADVAPAEPEIQTEKKSLTESVNGDGNASQEATQRR